MSLFGNYFSFFSGLHAHPNLTGHKIEKANFKEMMLYCVLAAKLNIPAWNCQILPKYNTK
jgi:hypothetical protein